MEKKYILGMDIGISSVGWALLDLDEFDNPYKIIDVGSRIFAPGEVEKTGDSRAKARREKRGARRIIRRRAFRLDRVRNLLYQYGYLNGEVNSDIVSIKNEELTNIYDKMVNNYYKNKDKNPYKLKVEALDRKLTSEELCIILVHYAKKRGYKSNREDVNDNETGKVLSAIKENICLMEEKKYRTVSEMYIKDDKFKDKIKNSPGEYKVSISNEMYLEEINMVLDSQIKYGLIDNKFKDNYLEIWSSRRHYSNGPGGNSPYGGNLIEKMTGQCKFDKKPRAPKRAYSTELFLALTKILNTKYKLDDSNEFVNFSKEEIFKIIELAKNEKQVTYKNVLSILGSQNVIFKDLKLSKKDYIKVIEEIKKSLGISKEEKLELNKLTAEEKEQYDKLYNKKIVSQTFIELKGYQELKKCIIKSFGKEKWEEVHDNIKLLDDLALFCTNYKLNSEIKEKISNSTNIPKEFCDDNFISILPNFKDHVMLSTDIIRDLIPLMMNGERYDEAMKKINKNFTNPNECLVKKDLLVPIYLDQDITNQRVIRSLTQARKVLNAIIKKYGRPYCINIETARELAKTKKERNEIEKKQQENYDKNIKIKNHMVELGLFKSIDDINSNDLLKYKLWEEQKGICSYSLEKIKIEDLYFNNVVQIDHILPYSRTFNDNYLNKTLVLSKANQDKGDRTPFEWFGNTNKWNEYVKFINSLIIPQSKKDNYLLKELTYDMTREMREQNLNDTKYISKEFASLIKTYLNVDNVNVYQGALTAKLRARWGLNRLTHSYIAQNYMMPDDMKEGLSKDRDNHLHHAMDALVIAATTKSLQQKITLYEKVSRYVDGLTRKKIAQMSVDELYNNEYIRIDEDTGVVDVDMFKEYLMNNIRYGKYDVAKLKFPLPYDNFADEAKMRVYERDLEVLKNGMRLLRTYSKKDINNLKILIPSIAKNKISGKMHEETYYGIKKIGDSTYKTLRKPLDKVKKKDLENIPDKDGGSKDIYNSLIAWFGDCEIGADALKKHNNEYPTNPNDKEHKPIKKLKVYENYNNTGHMINKSNVEKGGIYQIDVFKSKDKEDDKLYFAAFDILEIANINSIKKGKTIDFSVKLEYGQGKNNFYINYDNLLDKYEKVIQLGKNDLVKVTNKNNEVAIGYVVGCSSGMFEIKSTIGDGYDLIGETKIFGKIRSQFQITVSTIKSIEKLSINTLGEVNGL